MSGGSHVCGRRRCSDRVPRSSCRQATRGKDESGGRRRADEARKMSPTTAAPEPIPRGLRASGDYHSRRILPSSRVGLRPVVNPLWFLLIALLVSARGNAAARHQTTHFAGRSNTQCRTSLGAFEYAVLQQCVLRAICNMMKPPQRLPVCVTCSGGPYYRTEPKSANIRRSRRMFPVPWEGARVMRPSRRRGVPHRLD